jgi:hypothetical protein
MLAEDHCLPDQEWTAAILGRIDEGWDVVGPALRAGDRTTIWAKGSFLIGYGEWMEPVESGPAPILCGWNVVVRAELLRQFGSELEELLILGAFLIRRLAERGHRFYLDNRARMRHFDPPSAARQTALIFLVGMGFGALRTRHWPAAARFAYPLAGPLAGVMHWKRALAQFQRAGSVSGLGVGALLGSVVLALFWGMGEAAGAILGVRRVAPHLWRTEVKPVSAATVAASDAAEAAGADAAKDAAAKIATTGL